MKYAARVSTRWAVCFFVALMAASVSCSEENLQRLTADPYAEPASLELSEGCVGSRTELPFVLRNRGQAPVELVSASLEPPDADFDLPATGVTVPAGGSLELALGFSPSVPDRVHETTLVLAFSDDSVVVLPVRASAGIRNLAFRPASVDFGVVDEGTTATRVLELVNEGASPLTFSSLSFTSTSSELVLVNPPSAAVTLGCAESLMVGFSYAPVDLGTDSGVLTVLSDDPVRPRVEVSVTAEANLRPRVELWGCRSASGDAPGCPLETRSRRVAAGPDDLVALDASDTVDPEGGALVFSWAVLERPAESSAGVFPLSAPPGVADIRLDLGGRYVIEVRAVDARGLESAPDTVEIRPPDLEASLRWSVATDVDLHLVRPGGTVGDYGSGAPGRSQGSDCSAFNRAPVWGDPASTLDDPGLRQDAVSTRGPELVTLDRPEAGVYRVFAHYCDSRDVRVATDAALELSSRGSVVAELGPTRLAPGELWEAGTLTWDSASETWTVRPSTAPPEARPELCRTP